MTLVKRIDRNQAREKRLIPAIERLTFSGFTEITFGPEIDPQCRLVAINYLRNDAIDPDVILELVRELLVEAPEKVILSGIPYIVNLQNANLRIRYFKVSEVCYLHVKVTLYLFGDIIFRHLMFRYANGLVLPRQEVA